MVAILRGSIKTRRQTHLEKLIEEVIVQGGPAATSDTRVLIDTSAIRLNKPDWSINCSQALSE